MFFGVSGFGGRSRCGILLYDSGVHYTPNPGTIEPPISRFAQFRLRFGVCESMFDRKLLEYLP